MKHVQKRKNNWGDNIQCKVNDFLLLFFFCMFRSSWIFAIQFDVCEVIESFNEHNYSVQCSAFSAPYQFQLSNSKHFVQIIDLNKPTNQLKRFFFLFRLLSSILFEQWSDFSLRLKTETKGKKHVNRIRYRETRETSVDRKGYSQQIQ